MTHIDQLLEAVPAPMLHLSAAGHIAATNAAARALLGDWIAGRSCASVLRQPGLLNRIEALQAGGAGEEVRWHLADRRGETQFLVRITPLDHAKRGPGPRALLLHFTDTTQLHEAEQMRRDFVANLSHELRTPLTAVTGFIETLRGPARNDAAARDRFLGIMDDEVQRMNRLVGDLLSLSRVEQQERQRPTDTVDLTTILNGVIAALRPMAENQDSALRLEIDAPAAAKDDANDRFEVRGDGDQLTQVFLNLTENALKYGGAGRPVTLRLARPTGSGNIRGRMLCAEVIDRGEGIDPDHLPRLTERFYRIDTHRSRAMGGTGLGLAIAKHIVNRHRGRLRINSTPGEGSVFAVFLPTD